MNARKRTRDILANASDNIKILTVTGICKNYAFPSSPSFTLQRFVCLRKLNLSHCNLVVVPRCLTNLMTLEDIDLGTNDLRSLPSNLKACSRLQSLNLENNHKLPSPFRQKFLDRRLIPFDKILVSYFIHDLRSRNVAILLGIARRQKVLTRDVVLLLARVMYTVALEKLPSLAEKFAHRPIKIRK